MKNRAEGLIIKPGPSQGEIGYKPVGGEILQPDKVSMILSQEWMILLLILIPMTLLLFYKKPGILLRLLSGFMR